MGLGLRPRLIRSCITVTSERIWDHKEHRHEAHANRHTHNYSTFSKYQKSKAFKTMFIARKAATRQDFRVFSRLNFWHSHTAASTTLTGGSRMLAGKSGEVELGHFSIDKSTKQSFVLNTNDYKMLPWDTFWERKVREKCVWSWGSTPDPARGAYGAPSDSLAGPGEEKAEGKEEEGKGGERDSCDLGEGCFLALMGDERHC